MKILRKLVLITFFFGLLIYGAYLVKCRLGIDVDEYRHAGDYLAAIAHPQRLAYAMPPSSSRDEQNLKGRDSQPISTTIVVDVAQPNGIVNDLVFGNNIIAYDPMTYENWAKEYYGYSDYGAGIWDSKWETSVEEVIKLAKDAGVSVIRFPGGCGTHHYDWRKAIGKNRERFLFGLDEFLKVAHEINAEPIMTLSYFIGDENSDADLVEYLNAPNNGYNPNGDIDWAAERAKNGHPEPYKVKYFEVGNEVWHGDHRAIKKVSADEYAKRYLKYYAALKSVDSEIKIGVLFFKDDWDKEVMRIINDKIDFAVVHVYFSGNWAGKDLSRIDPKRIFSDTLAEPESYNRKIQEKLKSIRELSGKGLPLAYTEYNSAFQQKEPVPYRHALGTALLNAELLRIFMKPENNILMANYWNFNNSYTGMIANGFNGEYRTLSNPYYKRPNYYVFELYAKHFGGEFIGVDVQGDGRAVNSFEYFHKMGVKSSDVTIVSESPLPKRWQIRDVKGIVTAEADGVFSIVFGEHQQWNYYHAFKQAEVEPSMYYRLSGYIKTENFVDDIGVSLEVQDARGWDATRSAAMTEKVKGTTDWRYVEALYQTLPDARAVKIIVRRNGAKGPYKGKAYFKDVKFEKFVPSIPDKIPYLSVNASKSSDGNKVYLMVVNKNMDKAMTATVDLQDFAPASKGGAWVLNGPGIDATNEKKHDNVKVTRHEFEIKGTPFEFTFEPHSLTAIEIERLRK